MVEHDDEEAARAGVLGEAVAGGREVEVPPGHPAAGEAEQDGSRRGHGGLDDLKGLSLFDGALPAGFNVPEPSDDHAARGGIVVSIVRELGLPVRFDSQRFLTEVFAGAYDGKSVRWRFAC